MIGIPVRALHLGIVLAPAHIVPAHQMPFVKGTSIPAIKVIRHLGTLVQTRLDHPLFIIVLGEAAERISVVHLAFLRLPRLLAPVHIRGGIDRQASRRVHHD
jgi:hypothetical protein